jgi:alkyl hydroperoxide reductase subunit AhpC
MGFRLDDTVANFWQDSSRGRLNLYNFASGGWVVFFSYRQDFSAVTTAEIAAAARLAPEFGRRGARLLGLSVDTAERHREWLKALEARHALRVDFPLVADSDRSVARLYGMLDPRDADRRTLPWLFIISPNKQLRFAETSRPAVPRDLTVVLRALDSLQARRNAAQTRGAHECEVV